MTEGEAWDLLNANYPPQTIADDPEWACDMVDALIEGTVTL